MKEWYSIREKEPPKDTSLIILDYFGNEVIATYDGSEYHSDQDFYIVTHWKKLA